MQARETAEVRYITRDIAEGLRRPQVEKSIYLVNRSIGYITTTGKKQSVVEEEIKFLIGRTEIYRDLIGWHLIGRIVLY